jgi:hypothetical protein
MLSSQVTRTIAAIVMITAGQTHLGFVLFTLRLQQFLNAPTIIISFPPVNLPHKPAPYDLLLLLLLFTTASN